MNELEEQRMGGLQQARQMVAIGKAASGNPLEIAKVSLSFGKKLSQHWLIIGAALLFDLVGLIPFLSIAVNLIFGLVLFLYFGPKKKTAGSELLKIGLPIAVGSIFDSVLSFLPVNTGAALIRIALD
jgi:hypothetical protein